ncbi:MAG: crotonobetaine/carnitine-CoA ligase [Parasphingorhabdus sp.]|jgi:crotonobetaine/carnitine-CoA ligase
MLISDSETILSLLQKRTQHSPDTVYARYAQQELTVSELSSRAGNIATALARLDIQPGDRVAVMMDNSLDYVVLYFALTWLGAIQVPVNTRLRHSALKYLIDHSEPKLIIAEESYLKLMHDAQCSVSNTNTISHSSENSSAWKLADSTQLNLNGPPINPVAAKGGDVLFIMYTSGTTGPPKGVLVTDKMFRTSAYAASLSAHAQDGDIFPIWEPLYHVGAAQLLPLPLMADIELNFIGTFSASSFWQKVRASKATHIHFLGGILQILLRQPADPLDQKHGCRIAWGGGAPATVALEFETRFNIQVREIYGMTEASSFTSINTDGHKGSVGQVAPYFKVKIVDQNDKEVAPHNHGEIAVRELEPGLITPGYYKNQAATHKAIRNQWFYTGDLGYFDENNYLYYSGRVKESIRRRGENISAWEIERVIERLSLVEQAAAIGVPDELGDEDIKLFVKLSKEGLESNGAENSLHEQIFSWCAEQLPEFQIPRYLTIVDQFPLTGTQRIRKELLPKHTEDSVVRVL